MSDRLYRLRYTFPTGTIDLLVHHPRHVLDHYMCIFLPDTLPVVSLGHCKKY